MSSRYLTSSHPAVLGAGRRGRHRRPTRAALASHRVLAGAALGSLVTLGAAAGPATAASHGSTQGAAQSDPDGTSNGGADKPGGTGGINKADQDGNNGSGNDSDCEDDDNGVGTPGSCAAHERPAARAAAREQDSTTVTVAAKAVARSQRAEVLAMVRAGAPSKQVGRAVLAELRSSLALQRTSRRVAVLELRSGIRADLHTATVQAVPAVAGSPAATAAGTTGTTGTTGATTTGTTTTGTAPAAAAAAGAVGPATVPLAAPAGTEVLGTSFSRTPLLVSASRVPAAQRSATSFTDVGTTSGVSAAMLPHTGSAGLAGLAGAGLGGVVVGGALLSAGRRREPAPARADHSAD